MEMEAWYQLPIPHEKSHWMDNSNHHFCAIHQKQESTFYFLLHPGLLFRSSMHRFPTSLSPLGQNTNKQKLCKADLLITDGQQRTKKVSVPQGSERLPWVEGISTVYALLYSTAEALWKTAHSQFYTTGATEQNFEAFLLPEEELM